MSGVFLFYNGHKMNLTAEILVLRVIIKFVKLKIILIIKLMFVEPRDHD